MEAAKSFALVFQSKVAVAVFVIAIFGLVMLLRGPKPPKGLIAGSSSLVTITDLGANRFIDKSGYQLTTDELPQVKNCRTCIDPSKIHHISWDPRIFLYEDFLTDEECDHLISLGDQKGLTRSKVAAADTKNQENKVRTSYGAFLSSEDPIMRGIEERIAKWTMIPPENGEVIYLLRYEIGQEYKAHHDFFHPDQPGMDKYIGSSGNRYATVLMYLETPEEGGETEFPFAKMSVKAVRGNAVLFWSQTPDWQLDTHSLHGSVPVVRGVKYCATKWIRIRRYSRRW